MKMMKFALMVMTIFPLVDVLCIEGFNQTDHRCFKAENTVRKNWTEAEAVCQQYGEHVHLAQINGRQVGIFMLYQSQNN